MSNINLFAFQKEDVDKLKSKLSRLVGSDPGTGKTYVGLALDQANRSGDGHPEVELPQVTKTLIISPLSVTGVWDQHCMELTTDDVYVLNPKKREPFIRALLNPKRGGYFIMHWEALRFVSPHLVKSRTLLFHIIADEVHRAKNRKAQQTIALKKIKTTYKTAMSGTPATNKPYDLWSILNWLWPNYYTSFHRFDKAYVIREMDEESGYTKVTGVKNLDHLHKQMSPWYVRRLKEDVLPDLPEKYYSRVWVTLEPKQRRAYDQMRKTMIAWAAHHKEELEREDPIIAQATVSQLVRLQQYSAAYVIPRLGENGEHMFRWKWSFKKSWTYQQKQEWKEQFAPTEEEPDKPEEGGAKKVFLYDMIDPSSKLDALMDILDDRGDEQIVVFSQYKQVIDLLEERLVRKEVSYATLTGSVLQEDRDLAVQRFQKGDARVFAGTIAAGGVGLTLTAASTVIFIDRTWDPAINIQAEDRLHRIGQKSAVEVIDLMARDTVDLGKSQQIKLKWTWIQKLLGDKVDTEMVLKEMKDGSR